MTGVATLAAALLAAGAVLAWWRASDGVAAGRVRRLRAAAMPTAVPAPAGGAGRAAIPTSLAAAILAGLGVAVLIGGMVGAFAGVVLALSLNVWLSRLPSRAERLRQARIRADLPIAADLLAACLLSGSTQLDAVEAVAEAVEGPLRAHLRRVVATLRLGGDPAASWMALAEEPELATLGWSLARAAESGGALAPALVRMADEQRLAQRWAAEAAARRVSVQAAAPLGLCFLPAFVLTGVVPVVIGMLAGVTA
jgi:pilus assembly protein TadC